MHSYRSSRPGSMRRSKHPGEDDGELSSPARRSHSMRSYSGSYYSAPPTGRESGDSGHAEVGISQDPASSEDRAWYDFTTSCTLASQPSTTDHTYESIPSQVPLTITQSSGYSSPEISSLSTTSDDPIGHRQQALAKWRRASEPAVVGQATLSVNVHVDVNSCSSGSNYESTLTSEVQPTISQYTIECSPEVVVSRQYPASTSTSAKFNQYPVSTNTPASLVYHQSQASIAESCNSSTSELSEDIGLVLVPAASPLQEEVLDYLMPQLMQYMNPQALLPYLQRNSLVSEEDIDYICNPLRTDLERRQRIITRSPYRDPEAFDRFVLCLAEEPEHTGHKYLTRRLREAIQRKRQSPFKRLSSIRMTSPPSLNSSRWQFSQRISPQEQAKLPQPPTPYHSASLDRGMTKKKGLLTRPAPIGGAKIRRQHSESAADKLSTFLRSTERKIPAWPLEEEEVSYSPVRIALPRSYSQSEALSAHERPSLPQRSRANYTTSLYSTVKDEQLTKKKVQWLQERVQMIDCSEHVVFTSKTHYGDERQLLYSGTLTHHGRPRFVVLFNDMLLVLKAKRRSHSQGRLGSVFSQTQPSHLDWFADQAFTTKEPYLLHLLTVQKQSKRNYVCLNYKHHSEVKELCLQACSEEAKKVWEDQLLDAIKLCTATHAESILHVGTRSPVSRRQSGRPYTKLTVKMLWIEFTKDYRSSPLYCVVIACDKKCRTNDFTVEAASNWSFTCEFTDVVETDTFTLFFELYKETVFQPDECLGSAGIQLSLGPQGRQVMRGQLQLEDCNGSVVARVAVHNELGWETKM